MYVTIGPKRTKIVNGVRITNMTGRPIKVMLEPVKRLTVEDESPEKPLTPAR